MKIGSRASCRFLLLKQGLLTVARNAAVTRELDHHDGARATNWLRDGGAVQVGDPGRCYVVAVVNIDEAAMMPAGVGSFARSASCGQVAAIDLLVVGLRVERIKRDSREKRRTGQGPTAV